MPRREIMLKKIKKFFLFLCLIFSGLFLPTHFASAALKDLFFKLAAWPIFYIIYLIVKIAIFLVGLAGSLLNWVLSPGFISYSYTNPGGPNGNPVIEAGLSVTQGFVNMFLVLVLVYIAIATILRLAGYETKKLLVTFIIVALLINFAPIICGLIVDASNIVMNFFVQDLKADAFGELMGRRVEQIAFKFDESLGAESWQMVLEVAVLAPFLFALTFVLLIFVLIFMLRHLVIWLMVILSPLAFVAYILPATRKYFEQWWKQFLAWSFIGVTCGFFLYLGLLLVVKFQAGGAVGSPTTGGSGAFDAILPYFVSLVFLGLGIVFGLQTSTTGAGAITNFVKTKGRAVVRGTGKSAKWVARKAARGVGRYVEEKAGVKEKVGKVAEKWSKVPMGRWFLPERLKKYGEFRPAIDEAKAEAKAYKSSVLMDDVMTGAAIGKRAGGFTLETVMRGASEDIFHAGRRKFGGELTDEELLHNERFRKVMKRTLQVEKEGGYLSDVIRRDPRLAALLTGESWAGDYRTMTEKQAIQQATSEARGSHITNWEKQVVAKEHLGLPVTEKLMERGREPFENIARNVKQGVETVQDSIDELFSRYAKRAARVFNIDLSKPLAKNDHETLWSGFREFFRKHHKNQEGFFVALESQRFRDLGYREGRYRPPQTPGTPSTPAQALGIEGYTGGGGPSQ